MGCRRAGREDERAAAPKMFERQPTALDIGMKKRLTVGAALYANPEAILSYRFLQTSRRD